MNRTIIIAVIWAIYSSASATIINVPGDYPTIQTGINASTDADTVLVQPGTYVENINFNGHNIVLGSLFITTGDTSHISQTVIDGDSAGTVVTFDSGEDSTAVITGLTIRNGLSLSFHNWYRGGGLTCLNNSNPSILNNLISENFSFEEYGSAAIGCGGSSPFIFNNIISGNIGIYKSGISCWNYSNAIIIDNIVHGNIKIENTTTEGVIHCTDHSDAIIINNTINANSGVGIGIVYESSPVIENNTIAGNGFNGIGIGMNSTPIINKNVISENGNSGIYCNNSSPIISNNYIWGTVGDGIFSIYNSSPIVNNNIILRNLGDGIYFQDNSSYVNNNTIIENNDYGIYCNGSELTIVNSILWDNNGSTGNQIFIQSGTAIAEYCDIQGGWTGEGNIDLQPLFCDSANGDYHLMSTACGNLYDSPCIDSGSPHYSDSLLDCSWGLGSVASDMGAYGGGDTIIVGTNVINVPIDYPTIQMAIDSSGTGDTVCVLPGTYYENINFNGHNIVVGSMFMMTGNDSYILSTIIDGSDSASVVTFDSEEDSTAFVLGFTIQNGWGNHGGGIYCFNSNPTISKNIIKDNSVSSFGGGILFLNSSSIFSKNLVIDNNANMGGGICCMDAEPTLIDNSISRNSADSTGGGIFCTLSSDPFIVNTIFWADIAAVAPEIDHDSSSNPNITYCDVQNGWAGVGNIDCCPEFCSPAIEDFHITSISCCLGAGSGGVDIGAFGVGCDSLTPNCSYVTGDINGSDSYNGLDITYGVSYLKGGEPPVYECECTSCNIWYVSGDVNGTCSYNGLDITYGVSYLKGIQTELFPCPDCPPVR